MKEEKLKLLPGVKAAEENGRFGLTLRGRTRLTGDERQIFVLRALLTGEQTVEHLNSLLRSSCAPSGGEAFTALALAELILNFKEYLEP